MTRARLALARGDVGWWASLLPHAADRAPSGITISQHLVMIAIALAMRLFLLPGATIFSGDDVTRVWRGWRWLDAPELVTSGGWGPLHFYLIGGALAVWPDPRLAPVAMHIVFAAATAPLLALFVRELFGSTRVGFLVGLAYALYPVSIYDSLTPRSEIIFVFFLVAALLLLARARQETGTWLQAAFAGICLGLGSMLRYEAWPLIVLLAPLLLHRPEKLLAFLVPALIHPIIWSVGNLVEFGDLLYGINWSRNFELNLMGKAAVPFRKRLTGLGTFVGIGLRGLSPLVALAALIGLVLSLRQPRYWLWLLPLAGLNAMLAWGMLHGGMVPKLQYSVIPEVDFIVHLLVKCPES